MGRREAFCCQSDYCTDMDTASNSDNSSNNNKKTTRKKIKVPKRNVNKNKDGKYKPNFSPNSEVEIIPVENFGEQNKNENGVDRDTQIKFQNSGGAGVDNR